MHACVWVCAWYVRVCDHAWGLEVRGDLSVVARVGLEVVRWRVAAARVGGDARVFAY